MASDLPVSIMVKKFILPVDGAAADWGGRVVLCGWPLEAYQSVDRSLPGTWYGPYILFVMPHQDFRLRYSCPDVPGSWYRTRTVVQVGLTEGPIPDRDLRPIGPYSTFVHSWWPYPGIFIPVGTKANR